MPLDEPVHEALAFLTRSPTRLHVLEALAADGPQSRRELGGRFDVARTTVGRALDALADRGWVRSTHDGAYALTDAGGLLAASLAGVADGLGVAVRLQPFLAHFPAGRFDLELAWLADAELVVSTPTDPYAPVTRHVEAFEAAERFRCLLPAVGLPAMQAARERVVGDGASQSLVVGPAVAATLRSAPTYREAIGEMTGTGRCELWVAAEPVPVYLGLVDGATVQIGVEDDDGVPRALVESTDGRVREWAEAVFERYREAGVAFEVDG